MAAACFRGNADVLQMMPKLMEIGLSLRSRTIVPEGSEEAMLLERGRFRVLRLHSSSMRSCCRFPLCSFGSRAIPERRFRFFPIGTVVSRDEQAMLSEILQADALIFCRRVSFGHEHCQLFRKKRFKIKVCSDCRRRADGEVELPLQKPFGERRRVSDFDGYPDLWMFC